MSATNFSSTSASQWLFPLSAFHYTPSRTTSGITLERELYDRARGVEFLFRLGVSLQIPSSAMFTAATWLHRFYMRYSLEDYHRQDVAASCLFLATKTEECGRKLRDLAKVYCSKVTRVDMSDIPDESKELDAYQTQILSTEEALLEGLCFDFVVESPHAFLVDLFDVRQGDHLLEEYAWSIANDSMRTPLCVLYSPRIVAAACYILAQYVLEGPLSSSLDARIASPAPSASLPTPPSHKAVSPQVSRFVVEYFAFNEMDLADVAESLRIILDFYSSQDPQGYLGTVGAVSPPESVALKERLYPLFTPIAPDAQAVPSGSSSPAKPQARSWKPVQGFTRVDEMKTDSSTTI